jgi:hypothetical protein
LNKHLGLSTFAFVLILGTMSHPSLSQSLLPDLAFTKIWIGDKNNTPISPKAGEGFYVCATVKNLGSALAEGYFVQPYFGGSALAAGGPGRLEGGGAQDWASGPIVVAPGIYEVRWVLNPDHKIPESDYANNEISMIITIEPHSSLDTMLQPVGGFVGIGILTLVVLAAAMIARKFVQKRKENAPAETNKPKAVNQQS